MTPAVGGGVDDDGFGDGLALVPPLVGGDPWWLRYGFAHLSDGEASNQALTRPEPNATANSSGLIISD